MNTPKSIEELTSQIEELVHLYLADGRRAAEKAVERAFGTMPARRSGKQRAPKASPSNGTSRRRRTPDEVSALGEQLYELVLEHPGEAMTKFAAELGVPVRELHRPMSALKQDGRVRSVGRRQAMRYFPGAAGRGPARA